MDIQTQRIFLVLILVQVAHSLEEYIFELYDVFTPARIISGLVSDDLAFGFSTVNIIFISFGFWCYFIKIRPGHASARALAWFWVVLEFINGIGHPIIAFSRSGYFPGMITALFLLIFSIWLGIKLINPPPNEKMAI